MKSLSCLFLLLPLCLPAQSTCDRYLDAIFPAVTLTSDILYGNNTTIGGVNTQLYLDFYEPAGDTQQIRPLIILVHGFPGSKTDANIVYFCEKFAQRGFVVASVNTTVIDIPPADTVVGGTAVVKAMFDLKAAIRYFKQDFSTVNAHQVDTAHIFAGGFSWGALTGLYAAFGDVPEFYLGVQPIFSTTPGGIEGNSGNPGYSSQFHGVINIAGQITDVHDIDGPNLIPIVGIHGTDDVISPYDQGLNTLGASVFGSGRIHEYADSIGLKNHLITIPGGGHFDFYTNSSYRDSTEIQFSEFFYQLITGTDSVPRPQVAWEIAPVVCETAAPVALSAVPGGGGFIGPAVDNGVFSPAVAGLGVHTLSYQVVDSCGNYLESKQEVEVLPAPDAPVLSQVSDSLMSDAIGTHTWYLNGVLLPGADSSYLVPTVSGVYRAEVTGDNGCISVTSADFAFIATSLSTLDDAAWQVFPNPASGRLHLMYVGVAITQVEMVDMLGRQIAFRQQQAADRTTIQTSFKGVAVIRIRTERGGGVRRVVFE